MPLPGTEKQANLIPGSIGFEPVQHTLLPMEVWEYDGPDESPRDVVLKAGNRLTVPDAIVTNDLNVQRDLDVDRNLNVDGTAQIDGEAHFDSNVHAKSTVQIGGVTTLSGGKRVSVSSTSTTPFTFTDTDGIEYLLVTTGASAFTVNLPTAADNAGREIEIWKVDSGAGKITVDGEGSETIDGGLTVGIWHQRNWLRLVCTGTEWFIKGAPGLIYLKTRPSGWVLSAVRSAGAWATTTAFRTYAPDGRKAYYLQGTLNWVGDGATDDESAYLRPKGDTSYTANHYDTPTLLLKHTNLGSSVNLAAMHRLIVPCDSNGDIDYYGPEVADAALYATILGYTMMV